MSVYTAISAAELADFLRNYDCGELVQFNGITAGIENSNYAVTTTSGNFILTLFERSDPNNLPFCLDLMAHLADNGIPSAHPIALRSGEYLRVLKNKPAVLVVHLPGASVTEPSRQQCAALGQSLAAMHSISRSISARRDDERGVDWHRSTAAKVASQLNAEDKMLLDEELEARLTLDLTILPQGVIHADLFRDNVLFSAQEISGLIDFYYAHTNALLYDLAVVVSDWCFEPGSGFSSERMTSITGAYVRERSLTDAEIAAFVPCLRAAGLRFWLSRLEDLHFPRGGAITHTKDPKHFAALLKLIARTGSELTNILSEAN